jgi:hypothetical protein
LGRPNAVDHGSLGQQTWRVGNIRIYNWLAPGTRLPTNETVTVHKLSIFFANPPSSSDESPAGPTS